MVRYAAGMQIDAKTFFILVTTLAAGGAGGYVASEKRLLPPLEPRKEPPAPPPAAPPPPPPPVVVDAGPVAPLAPPPLPPCDDGAGQAGDCPPPGFPTFEGGCGNYATTRCAEFKQAMKPRVAQAAVACLAKLTPQERCDPKRVDLCGHTALQNACIEPDMASYVGWDAGPAPPNSVTVACQALLATPGCAAASVPPSLVDCQRTLAGMTAAGREHMAACLKKHCATKGLLGCEAVAKP